VEALGQLDWCIRYLDEIKRRQLAARLAKNRDHISRSLRRADRAG
jgi:DNA-binding transcriptional regulator LsrR (DeoR family)